MGRVIGIIILLAVFGTLFTMTCLVAGIKLALFG